MEAIRETQKKYCSRAIAAAIIIGFALILSGQKSIGRGLVLGTFFSVVNFILIGETLPMRIGLSKGKAAVFSLFSMSLRYMLLAVPIVVAIKFDRFNPASAIIGIFMIQLVILSEHIYASFVSLISGRRKQA